MSTPASHNASALTVSDYLAGLAAPRPTPGGGSAVAVAASLAAALAEMVLGITLGGKEPPDDAQEIDSARETAAAARSTLLALAAADEAAYAGYRAAAALPRVTDEDKQSRRAAIQVALLESADVPIEIARTGVTVLEALLVAARHGTKHALSDVSSGALLARAAIEGALLTANVNVDLMADAVRADRYRESIAHIETMTRSKTASVLATVGARIGTS